MNNVMAEIEIMLPQKNTEMEEISRMLIRLDSLITLHQREPRFADTG